MKRKRVRERKNISAQEETVESFNCHPPVSIYPLNWRSSFLARTHEYKVRQVELTHSIRELAVGTPDQHAPLVLLTVAGWAVWKWKQTTQSEHLNPHFEVIHICQSLFYSFMSPPCPSYPPLKLSQSPASLFSYPSTHLCMFPSD